MRFALYAAFAAGSLFGAEQQLTIYNQNFAVIRETVPLDLRAGRNEVQFAGATAHVEPSSVILRDAAGTALQILEQNYRNDPVSQELLLGLFEGKTIQFEIRDVTGTHVVDGKIVRSGYVPHTNAFQRYGSQYVSNQMGIASGGAGQPLIEIEGKLRFGLPGTPIFPSLPSDTILKPTLSWLLEAPRAAKLNAELSYVSGGMSWVADYNMVAKEGSEKLALTGWITMDNQSGKQFDQARIQLMAGDVQKVRQGAGMGGGGGVMGGIIGGMPGAPPVTEQKFEDYHLYTLDNATTLRDRETKQVEFARSSTVASRRLYVYDGAVFSGQQYWQNGQFQNQPGLGTQSSSKVWIMRQFENSKANGLGIPLPKGTVRFYSQDAQGRLQFIGENIIDHTPQGEAVSVYTGNAFDVVGNRIRTDLHMDQGRREWDETYEITVRNRKAEAISARVDEHLFRGDEWKIVTSSQPFDKVDSHLIHFQVNLMPNEEKKVTYQVRYTW